jgi:hypothetical protein
MSYTVHIKPAKDSVRRDADHISLEEWLVYVRSDDEMRLIGGALIKTPKGDTVRYDGPGLTEWTDRQTGRKALFDYHRVGGKVSVANPSRETLVKMFTVAKAFGGLVQGDGGECYDASGNPA